MNWGEPIVVLNMWFGPRERYDVGGKFIEEVIAGPNKGKLRVNVNTVNIDLMPNRVMAAERYWAAYNAKSLIKGAANKPLFVEGQ